MANTEAEWVPKGEEPDPPYDPPPIDSVEEPTAVTSEEVLEAARKVPGRAEIIGALDVFRGPFAQTRRREIAAATWPELASLIWASQDQYVAPSPDTSDLETGSTSDLAEGVRWSDNAGCPVHIDATSHQERYIAEQAITEANAEVDKIVQRWGELLDDANLHESVFTANSIRKAELLLKAFPESHKYELEAISELFAADWTGDAASAKGNEFFGYETLISGRSNQQEIATDLFNYAVDDIRLHITLHMALAQTLIDTYNEMAKKAHLSLEVNALQSLADALVLASLVPVAAPYAVAATGFVLWLVTKVGDFTFTTTWENIASTNEIAKWTGDLMKAGDDVETQMSDARAEQEANLATKLQNRIITDPKFIPGEGYQDA